jgi:hypothetical protein
MATEGVPNFVRVDEMTGSPTTYLASLGFFVLPFE